MLSNLDSNFLYDYTILVLLKSTSIIIVKNQSTILHNNCINFFIKKYNVCFKVYVFDIISSTFFISCIIFLSQLKRQVTFQQPLLKNQS